MCFSTHIRVYHLHILIFLMINSVWAHLKNKSKILKKIRELYMVEHKIFVRTFFLELSCDVFASVGVEEAAMIRSISGFTSSTGDGTLLSLTKSIPESSDGM